jgi:hypothetical protein
MKLSERALLRDCSAALDHWLHQYAPEYCDKVKVMSSSFQMSAAGGTLAYIARLQQRIRKALK